MKIVEVHSIISKGFFAVSAEWYGIQETVYTAIRSVVWPPGSDRFTIYPQSGKKRGQGNGVTPIKNEAITYLVKNGWHKNYPWPVGTKKVPANLDAAIRIQQGLVGFEWETGNISSSHRSLNKLCLGLLRSETIGGFLVVPSKAFAVYLTDRIGNMPELEPYLDFWAATPCREGSLEIVVIEHDDESENVPRIPKGTDGRSKS